MGQFQVYKNGRNKTFPLVLDVQASVLSKLATRVVVPMAPIKTYGATPMSRLNPVVKVDRVRYVLVFQELSAVGSDELGDSVGSLSTHRTEIVAALDLLFTGI